MATSNTEPSGTNQYVRLRTILDSLEDGSIRYYLQFQDSPDRGKHFEELESQLMPIVQWLWGGAEAINCPPGYSNCDGVCVPYVCPRDPEELAKVAHN